MNAHTHARNIKSIDRAYLSWPAPLVFPVLGIDQIHVWGWNLCIDDRKVRTLRTELSTEEIDRAERFVFERDRVRFIVSHARVRQLLARYVGSAPGSLRFHANKYGKPELMGESPLRFNLTHSGDVGILAVASDIELGVDVELIRPMSESIAEGFFTESEREAIRKQPVCDRLSPFFACWTCKEAFLKGIGVGLSGDLASFSAIPNQEPGSSVRLQGRQTVGWTLEQLYPSPSYIGAIAYRASSPRSILYRSVPEGYLL
jgi:4'-phosphopantetheinyl transferase